LGGAVFTKRSVVISAPRCHPTSQQLEL